MKPSKTYSLTKLFRNRLALFIAVALITLGVPHAEACARVLMSVPPALHVDRSILAIEPHSGNSRERKVRGPGLSANLSA